MSLYTGRKWVNPLNKNIGRRTGKDVRAGKNIRVDKYGFENFDDYFSESDAELTRDFSRHQAIKEEPGSVGTQDSEDEHKENQSSQCNTASQIMPNSVLSNTTCNNFQSSQTLSQCGPSNTSKFGWVRNRNIGRRTGKNLTAKKQIRVDEHGFENFDDYLSESDMSSMSSRLSVSAVRPNRRGDTISSSYKEDEAQSLSSKTSQRTAITDESQSSESSQEDRANSQPEFREQGNITNIVSEQTSHYEDVSTSDDEKTLDRKSNQNSLQSHSDRSVSKRNHHSEDVEEEDIEKERVDDDDTKQMSSRTFQSSYIDTPVSSKSSRSYSKVVSDRHSNSKISINNKTQDRSSYKNDSSRHDLTNRSSSHITQGKGEMSVEINRSKTTVKDLKINNDNDVSQRKHKGRREVNESLQKKHLKTTDNTNNSINNDNSKVKPKTSIAINESNHGNLSKTLEKTEDSYNSDEDEEESKNDDDESEEQINEPDVEDSEEIESAGEDSELENDDEHVDSHMSEESDNVDHSEDESDEDMVKTDNITETKVDANKTALAKYEEKEHSRKKSDIKSVSRNKQEVNKTNGSTLESEKEYDEENSDVHEDGDIDHEGDDIDDNVDHEGDDVDHEGDDIDHEDDDIDDDHEGDDIDDDHEGDDIDHDVDDDDDEQDELRPSQAPSNIDVAGNKSGSITKLDIPLSVVSFNRTRKRLSYSAGEASEKTLNRNKSRMEEANAELFNSVVSESSRASKVDLKELPKKDNTEKLNKANAENSVSKKKAIDVKGDENSDFVSLTSRSYFAHTTETVSVEDNDEDDDIEILDYDKSRNKPRVDRKLSTKGRPRKQPHNSGSESLSDDGKQTELKQFKKVSKTEVKVKKTKDSDKVRRKTAHDLNDTYDLEDSNSKLKRQTSKSNTVMTESLNPYDDNAVNSYTDSNSNSEGDGKEDKRRKTNDKLKRKKEDLDEMESHAVENNLPIARYEKGKKRKSPKVVHTETDVVDSKCKTNDIDSRTSASYAQNEPEEYDSVIHEPKSKNKLKKKLQENTKKSVSKKGKATKNPKSTKKANSIPDDTELSDHIENDYLETVNDDINEVSPAPDINISTKKVRENERLKERTKKGSKGKSSTEDDVEMATNTKKTEKSKSDRKSEKAMKDVSNDIDMYKDNELLENSGHSGLKKGKTAKNSKLKRKVSSITDDLELRDDIDNDCLESDSINEESPAQKVKISSKKVRKNLPRENENSKEQTRKRSKRKSSSEEDGQEEMNMKKTKKSKPGRKSRKAKKDVSVDNDMYPDEEADTGEEHLSDSNDATPKPDTRLSMPTNFGSGVSFRVSRRSELLEDVRSGYIGEVNVEMEPTGGLTPCISRAGAARKSKGRRVTICPEENIEHNISSGTPSIDSTTLPHFDTTPVHICETTNSTTPCPDESCIEDRLIKPSPPEEGLRRSQRTRLKPIAWYKNEQVVFDYRRRSGPAIIGVKPSLEVKWGKLEEEKRRRRKLNYQIRKASQQGKDKPYRKLSIHRGIPSDIELADNSDPEITIYNHDLDAEDGIECIGKREAYKPVGPTHTTPKREDPYLITKQLNHPCMSAGKLTIKPNAEKPEQLVTADYVVFSIEYGKLLVKIHKTTTMLETGDIFMVPTGNSYSITNLRNDTAKLFYTLHNTLADNSEASLRKTSSSRTECLNVV